MNAPKAWHRIDKGDGSVMLVPERRVREILMGHNGLTSKEARLILNSGLACSTFADYELRDIPTDLDKAEDGAR